MHWAISRQTAVEIIVSRVDADKPNMALTTWKNAPNGMIRNPDVSIAKNYLNEMEMDDLNRIVSMYLDYAERQAKKRTSETSPTSIIVGVDSQTRLSIEIWLQLIRTNKNNGINLAIVINLTNPSPCLTPIILI